MFWGGSLVPLPDLREVGPESLLALVSLQLQGGSRRRHLHTGTSVDPWDLLDTVSSPWAGTHLPRLTGSPCLPRAVSPGGIHRVCGQELSFFLKRIIFGGDKRARKGSGCQDTGPSSPKVPCAGQGCGLPKFLLLFAAADHSS